MIKVIKKEKDELHLEIANLTIAELLRNYLWQDSATVLAAWKREHPSKNPVLVLKTKGKNPKKVLEDTITKIRKINAKLISEFKKFK
jgi:DNA-directed RNA polymerase subunit L